MTVRMHWGHRQLDDVHIRIVGWFQKESWLRKCSKIHWLQLLPVFIFQFFSFTASKFLLLSSLFSSFPVFLLSLLPFISLIHLYFLRPSLSIFSHALRVCLGGCCFVFLHFHQKNMFKCIWRESWSALCILSTPWGIMSVLLFPEPVLLFRHNQNEWVVSNPEWEI